MIVCWQEHNGLSQKNKRRQEQNGHTYQPLSITLNVHIFQGSSVTFMSDILPHYNEKFLYRQNGGSQIADKSSLCW